MHLCREVLQLLLGQDLLDANLALDGGPPLGVVLHERFTVAWIVVQTIRHTHLVRRVRLAFLEGMDVVCAQAGVGGVADHCEGLHGVRVRGRHFVLMRLIYF